MNIIGHSIIKTKISSGSSAVALQEIAGILVSLTAMLEEGGTLQQAPDNIKALTKTTIDTCQKLADVLTDSIGKITAPIAPKEEETEKNKIED